MPPASTFSRKRAGALVRSLDRPVGAIADGGVVELERTFLTRRAPRPQLSHSVGRWLTRAVGVSGVKPATVLREGV